MLQCNSKLHFDFLIKVDKKGGCASITELHYAKIIKRPNCNICNNNFIINNLCFKINELNCKISC
jgi:hypothetical protein